jgi:hypothetical protein
MTTRTVTDRKPTPWTKADISREKLLKRKLEKKWLRSKLQSDYEAYKEQRNKYNTLLEGLKQKNLSDLIRNNKSNPRSMFKALGQALHRKTAPPLPPHTNDLDLANSFSNFFDDKITHIRDRLDKNASITPTTDRETFIAKPLSTFREMKFAKS